MKISDKDATGNSHGKENHKTWLKCTFFCWDDMILSKLLNFSGPVSSSFKGGYWYVCKSHCLAHSRCSAKLVLSPLGLLSHWGYGKFNWITNYHGVLQVLNTHLLNVNLNQRQRCSDLFQISVAWHNCEWPADGARCLQRNPSSLRFLPLNGVVPWEGVSV